MFTGLRVFLLLLSLFVGGLAHASLSFDGAPRASDEELDRMRGGYIVNLSGLEFLMAFSIERLTFINGELVSSFMFNPFSLTPLTQLTQDIALPSTEVVAPAPIEPLVVLADPIPPLSPVADSAITGDIVVPPATPHTVTAGGSSDTALPVNTTDPATQTAANGGGSEGVDASSSGGSSGSDNNPQTVRQGNLTFVQNGPGNAFALTGLDANAMATIVQNSLNDQVISTITTLNINLAAQMLAARERLDTLMNQGLSRLH